jgi:hypothetical protein
MAYTPTLAANIIQTTYLRSIQRARYWIEHDRPQIVTYYQRNKAKILLAAMLKYHLNENGEKQNAKNYYLKNRDKILKRQNTKVTCPICTSIVSKCNLKVHQTSKKCTSCIV